MAGVEDNTRALYEHYREKGIEVFFELNPGNHFRDAEGAVKEGGSLSLKRKMSWKRYHPCDIILVSQC